MTDELKDRIHETILAIFHGTPDDYLWGRKSEVAGVPSDLLYEYAGASLSNGSTGRELFRWWCARTSGGADPGVVGAAGCARIGAAMSEEALSPGFYLGLGGLAWAYCLIAKHEWPNEGWQDGLSGVDEAMLQASEKWNSELVDLVSGLCGLGIYALERMPSPWAVECLQRIVNKLSSLAIWDARGACWRTPPEWIPEDFSSQFPDGWCDLGMAHGLGGIIGFLAMVVEFLPEYTEAANLLQGATDFIASVLDEWGNGVDLPHAVRQGVGGGDDGRGIRKLPAWCYGSLGVACALSRAAIAMGSPKLRQTAIEMARAQSLRLPTPTLDSFDTGLCHGMAGNAHIFNVLYQRLGEEFMRDAALHWYDRLLGTRDVERPKDTLGGFRSYFKVRPTEVYWIRSTGILLGTSGIGLSLTAACNATPPAWDRALLI